MFKIVSVTALLLLVCTQSWSFERTNDTLEKSKARGNEQPERPEHTKEKKLPDPISALKNDTPLKLPALLISLLQVQDLIAGGDKDALKLQKHLMKLLDAGIAEHGSDWEISPAQFRALVIFGIVGTGSNSVIGALRQVRGSTSDAQLAKAIVHYRQGKRKLATEEFAKLEIKELDARLIPFVAFARGNLLSRSRPTIAITSYNIVRLTAPGTLLEETSLRRLMMLYSSQNDGRKFTRLAKQYARRFIKSPYRNQYLKMLRTGIFSMRQTISLEDVGTLGDLMPENYAAALHIHLLHQAVISGYIKLAEYSISRLNQLLVENSDIVVDEAKLTLLKILSRMRSDNPVELLAELEALDISRLTAHDIKLYNAAIGILTTILSPIDRLAKNSAIAEESAKSEGGSSLQTRKVSFGPTQKDKMQTSGTEQSFEVFIQRTQEKLSQIDIMLSQ